MAGGSGTATSTSSGGNTTGNASLSIRAGYTHSNTKAEVFGSEVVHTEEYYVSYPSSADRPAYLQGLKAEDFPYYYVQVSTVNNPAKKINAKVKYLGTKHPGVIMVSTKLAEALGLSYAPDQVGSGSKRIADSHRLNITLVPRSGNNYGFTQ